MQNPRTKADELYLRFLQIRFMVSTLNRVEWTFATSGFETILQQNYKQNCLNWSWHIVFGPHIPSGRLETPGICVKGCSFKLPHWSSLEVGLRTSGTNIRVLYISIICNGISIVKCLKHLMLRSSQLRSIEMARLVKRKQTICTQGLCAWSIQLLQACQV